MNRIDNQPINSSPFIVPLTHDVTSNHTQLWEKVNKQQSVGNEYRYQNIMKILGNSREITNKCMSNEIFSLSEFEFLSLDECSLYPSIVEIITNLPVSS